MVDAGLTFAPTGWPIVHPVSISIGSDGKAIFVVSASNGLNSLVVSSDGGATFAQSNLPASYEIALASSPRDPAIVLASLVAPYSANPLATYRSTDGGLSFQPLSNTGLVTGSTHRRTFVRGASAQVSQPRIFPWDGAFSVNAFGSPTPAHLRFAPGTTTAAPWVALTTTTGAYVSSDYGDHWHDIGGDAIPHAFYGAAWLGNRLVVSTAGEGVLESVPLF